jgi:hypothetical protein
MAQRLATRLVRELDVLRNQIIQVLLLNQIIQVIGFVV